ncbi:PD-(D/E)XK nuclease family protein [Halorubrum sp. C191]|uniref:RecB family exonuclease n=1 Tax=Halorubrum sp. C191 TaxID=1383842 RepID=UPI001304145F|nr:PD-(D/E)XK nuclease family protein [Halorubrum sp. C191]
MPEDSDVPATLDPNTWTLDFQSDVTSDTPDRDTKLSASRIKTFARCPLSYWFKYISDHEDVEPPGVPLRFGSRVHEAIEDVIAEDRAPLDRQDILESELLAAFESKTQYSVPDEKLSTGADCMRTAARFIANDQPSVRGVEQRVEFGIDIPDPVPTTAIMDLVTDDGLIDWKTGSIRDYTSHQEKIQGAVYMGAYLAEYGEPPESVRFVYLKEERVRSVEPSDEVWEYMTDYARRLVEAEESGQFPASTGSYCRSVCPYEVYCPAADAGAGTVPYEQY